MKTLLIGLMLLSPVVGFAQDKPPEKAQSIESRVRRLIEELGNNSYQAREKAHAALEKIGKPALKSLRKALKGADLEVAARAQELIEKITGKKFEFKPKADPPKPTPETPGLAPEILERLEKGLMDFLGRNDSNKKMLDSLQKLFEESQSETPDLSKMGELLEQFFKKTPEATPDQRSDIENEIGITLKPVDETLKSHIRILPDRQDGSWFGLKQGLVVKEIDPKGRAFAQGLRKHDILIFASSDAAPKDSFPGLRSWTDWRKKGVSLGSPANLATLKSNILFIEVIRRGKSGRVIELDLSYKKGATKKTRDF